VRNQSKWATDFDMMCRKTVLKLMLNKGDAPLSVQVQQAIKFDQSVIRDENDKPEYIDNNVEEAVAVEVAEAANKTELPEENQPIGKQEQPEIFK
jgi:recombinational DNA repair protein RecT